MIVRIATSNGPRYQVFGPDGKRDNDNDFDDFRNIGCGVLRVKLGDQWLTLGHNGKTRVC